MEARTDEPDTAWAHVGLDGAGADPTFDSFARLVRRHLGVSTALVSVVVADAQHYPGALGLPEPLQTERRSRFDDAMCSEVVRRREPLSFTDLTREDSPQAAALVSGLGVHAYAGHPVFDRSGRAVGTVCAMHHTARTWSDDDLDTLEDLAVACSAEIRLRQERFRAQEMQQVALRAGRRTRILLEITDMFARATTLSDVVATVQHAGRGVGATWAGLALLDAAGTSLEIVRDGTLLMPTPSTDVPVRIRLDDELPACHAVRTATAHWFEDGAAVIDRWPRVTRWVHPELGAHAYLPLDGEGSARGVVALGWPEPAHHDAETRELCATIVRSVANALDRVQVLEDRHRVASTLQAAMLTDLPRVEHLELAASYSTAIRTDQVGGDWYDAIARHRDRAVLTVGDVTGHDMRAAARMGQLRSMLRTLTWSGCDSSPARLLRDLEEANDGLGVGASATLLVARVERLDDGAQVRWTSAGHPPPVVLRADGTVDELAGRPDLLLGVDQHAPRHDHTAHLGLGDTIVLHTDGLVESRTVPYQERAAELRSVLAGLAGCPTVDLPVLLGEKLVPQPQRDDVAILAARVR
ncbi:SpoIIE family protein phosphatase [Isoptericola jiangsuensis]|uniref:SpoIIE family protein phosphatase n=1 Tax=Isoptericola jiangsuensis TaxID=548579 RepID=UPI003AAE6D60